MRLNEEELIGEVYHAVPPDQVQLAAANLPDHYLRRFVSFIGKVHPHVLMGLFLTCRPDAFVQRSCPTHRMLNITSCGSHTSLLTTALRSSTSLCLLCAPVSFLIFHMDKDTAIDTGFIRIGSDGISASASPTPL